MATGSVCKGCNTASGIAPTTLSLDVEAPDEKFREHVSGVTGGGLRSRQPATSAQSTPPQNMHSTPSELSPQPTSTSAQSTPPQFGLQPVTPHANKPSRSELSPPLALLSEPADQPHDSAALAIAATHQSTTSATHESTTSATVASATVASATHESTASATVASVTHESATSATVASVNHQSAASATLSSVRPIPECTNPRSAPVSSGGACTAVAQEEIVLPLRQCACCLELAEKHKKEMHDLALDSMCIAREEMHEKDQQIFKLQQQLEEAHTLAIQGQQSTHSEVSTGSQQLLSDSQQVHLWPHLHNDEQAAQQRDALAIGKKDRAHAVEVAALTRKLAEVETALEWSAAAFHKLSGKLGESEAAKQMYY